MRQGPSWWRMAQHNSSELGLGLGLHVILIMIMIIQSTPQSNGDTHTMHHG
jgi:hypothetical protein